jgi:hypothetical protein
LYADDYLIIFAWVLTVALSIIWQTQASAEILQFQLASGLFMATEQLPPAQQSQPLDPTLIETSLKQYIPTLEALWKSEVAIIILYNTALYAIKASCLVFFKHLRYRSGAIHKWFWILVSGFTLAAYIATIGVQQYRCWLGDVVFIASKYLRRLVRLGRTDL